jgi:hypothetical protein
MFGGKWLLVVASLPPFAVGCGGGGGPGPTADAGVDASVATCRPALDFTEQPMRGAWPPALWHAAMAPDHARGEVVLFGGLRDAGSETASPEVWTWSFPAGAWTNRTPSPLPASWPAARGDHMMAWDPLRRTILMFGGQTVVSSSDELWEWDGAAGTWTNLTPAQRPRAWPGTRWGHAMTYDVTRGRLVVFGGLGPPGWPSHAGDLWEWSSTDGTWIDRTPDPLPAAWPPPRVGAGLGHDAIRGTSLLYGGDGGVPLTDAWEWDGASGAWTVRMAASGPASWPPAAIWFRIVFHAGRGKLLMFPGDALVPGGAGPGGMQAIVWEWDGAAGTWADLTPAPLPASWPPPRAAPAVAIDPAGGVAFFGGRIFGEGYTNDLWIWGCAP